MRLSWHSLQSCAPCLICTCLVTGAKSELAAAPPPRVRDILGLQHCGKTIPVQKYPQLLQQSVKMAPFPLSSSFLRQFEDF